MENNLRPTQPVFCHRFLRLKFGNRPRQSIRIQSVCHQYVACQTPGCHPREGQTVTLQEVKKEVVPSDTSSPVVTDSASLLVTYPRTAKTVYFLPIRAGWERLEPTVLSEVTVELEGFDSEFVWMGRRYLHT
ncbi:hypothetical protein BaRGS_00028078, partial [Batillaria attramentaria]